MLLGHAWGHPFIVVHLEGAFLLIRVALVRLSHLVNAARRAVDQLGTQDDEIRVEH